MRRFLAKLEEWIIALLLGAMTIVTFSQVVARYVFNSGWIAALEVTTILFQWLVFFGISLAFKQRAHIGVAFFVSMMSKRGQITASFIAITAISLYIALVTVGGYELIETLYIAQIDAEDIPVRRWLLTLILPLGMLWLGWRLIEAALPLLKGETIRLSADEGPGEIPAEIPADAAANPSEKARE